MIFLQTLTASVKGSFPGIVYWLLLPLIPFIVAEQLRPVGRAPRFRDYWPNILISLSTAYMSLPLGIAAGLLSEQLRPLLPWKPLSFSFRDFGTLPVLSPQLQIVSLVSIP